MRISDWSSDVCSFDLKHGEHLVTFHQVGCRLAIGRRGFGGPPKRLRRFDGEHSQKPRPANVKRALLDDCAYAATWHGLEVLRHRNRSEEHTSELQSLMRISYAVFCLKKTKQTKKHNK